MTKAMKTFGVHSYTNYGTMVHIVNANNKSEARDIAVKDGAWDGCDVDEIDINKSGVVYYAPPEGG